MVARIVLYLISFGLAVAGGVTTIAYLNILATGHGMLEYFIFISTKVECYLLPIGILLLWLSIYWPLDKDEDEFF